MPTKEAKKFEHESYGMVSLSRIQGGIGRLFGSSLESQHTAVRLRIARGVRQHELGRDWYYAKEELIEVELSAAQFAELITTMNVGSGIPCTIRHVLGERRADPPEEPTEVEEVRESFREKAQRVGERLAALAGEVDAVLAKVPKKVREDVQGKLRSFITEVSSNMPFMVDQFQEATEKVIAHAKAEVDAFITHNVVAEGLRSITDRLERKALTAGEGPPKLPSSGPSDDPG